jgi:hypothetical protein
MRSQSEDGQLLPSSGYTYCKLVRASLEWLSALGMLEANKPRKPTPMRLDDDLIGTNHESLIPMPSIDCGKPADWMFTGYITFAQ